MYAVLCFQSDVISVYANFADASIGHFFIVHLWSVAEKYSLKQELVTELYNSFVIKLKDLSLCYVKLSQSLA